MGKHSITVGIDGVEVLFDVYIERRRSVRVAFGRRGIIVRIPVALSPDKRREHYHQAEAWVRKRIAKDPSLLEGYRLKDYDSIRELKIYGRTFGLRVTYADRKSGRGQYYAPTNTIHIVLPRGIDPLSKDDMIKKLLSRTCASLCQLDFERRVREINDQHFKKEIKSVNLKYNKSNWGSCSSVSNLNFSTRLLFAPSDVIDYVIVHELAHLYEMNHSPRFWGIVAQVMPQYKDQEAWLHEYGALCDF